MPPRAASMFRHSTSKINAPDSKKEEVKTPQKEDVDVDGEFQDDTFKKILETPKSEEEKPKFIYTAIEKAQKRKIIQEDIKQMRFEREIKQMEEKNGEYLHFSTIDSNTNDPSINVDIIIPQTVDSANISNEPKEEEKNQTNSISDQEFEQMKTKYQERLNSMSILQLQCSSKRKKLIENYHIIYMKSENQ